jgi:hypothetical protein
MLEATSTLTKGIRKGRRGSGERVGRERAIGLWFSMHCTRFYTLKKAREESEVVVVVDGVKVLGKTVG